MGNRLAGPGDRFMGPAEQPAYSGAGRMVPMGPEMGRRGSVYPGYPGPSYSPPGHLGDWLYRHRGVPMQDQERMLRADPSFRGLPPTEQQRVMQQLRDVDRMPEAQRQRRLARAEALEHMSPQERMLVRNSARLWAEQPPARRALMKDAFRDLRGVPPDQRLTVLNSERYQNAFSAQERDILANLLRAEPYEPPR